MLLQAFSIALLAKVILIAAATDPQPTPLLLTEAKKLLVPNYPAAEKGYVQTSDGMYFVSSRLSLYLFINSILMNHSKYTQ